MKQEDLFVDVDYCQRYKDRQDICGDAFYSQRIVEENRIISVLSDGLGSGVKANILASMTAKMALKFVASDMDFVHSAEIMMDALPVCQVRKISYATFTIVDSKLHASTRIIEMGNPGYILVRNGKLIHPEVKEITSPDWRDAMRFSEIETRPEDRIILLSDGITQAGLGTERYPLGWREEGCRKCVLREVTENPSISARQLAQSVMRNALGKEINQRPKDDMTSGVIYFRHPRKLILLTGPPFDMDRDSEYAHMLDDFEGRKVICGGTTANVIGRELNRTVRMDLRDNSQELPPRSLMKGVDLVSEGILTLTKTAQIMEQDLGLSEKNAAARLVELLRESDSIQFVVGSRINEAHQDPTLPLDIEIRRNIVRRIARVLEEKYFKDVSLTCI